MWLGTVVSRQVSCVRADDKVDCIRSAQVGLTHDFD
jgi:hypothetical protein